MVGCLKDDVSDLLNSLAANNEGYVHQLKKIREMLQAEIYYMREKVAALRSVGRKNSIEASSHKSGGHNICMLPKTLLQQSINQGNKKISESPYATSLVQQRNHSS